MCPYKAKKKVSKPKASVQDETVQPLATDLSNKCCVPRGQVSCPSPDILDKSSSIHVLCSNPQCPQSGLIHQKCFDKFESLAVMALGKHARCRGWSEKQKLNSLWKTRGVHSSYDLIFKICGCECGHGHIRRDLECDVEGREGAAAGVQAEQGKRKKKKSEVVKPKLNIPRDNISQKSVGNFSYSKHSKTGKSHKPVIDKLDEDDLDSNDNNPSIPGLQSSHEPLTLKLNLSDLKPTKERMKVKKTSLSESTSILEDDNEGWTTVSEDSVRNGNTSHLEVKKIEVDSMMSPDQMLQNVEEFSEVYQSDDVNVDNTSNIFMLDSKDDSTHGVLVNSCPETSIKGLSAVSYGSSWVESLAANVDTNGLKHISQERFEEILGNLHEEKLLEETAKKKALAEVNSLVEQNRVMSTKKIGFLTEKKGFLEDILSLNSSNMEMREVFEARENMLQMQILELQTLLRDEAYSKNLLLEKNENLERLVKSNEEEKKNSDINLEVAAKEWEQQIGQAAALVKAHERKVMEMLEKENMKMMKSAQTMEDRFESLCGTVHTMRENIEDISIKNLQSEEKLVKEKNLVMDLREELQAGRETGTKKILETVKEVIKSSTENDLARTGIEQILRKLDDVNHSQVKESIQDQKSDVQMSLASQTTNIIDSLNSPSHDNSVLMEALQTTREETRKIGRKVDILEGVVQNMQWKQMGMEKKLASSHLEANGSGMKEKIKDLIRDCDQFEEASDRMSGSMDRADQQMESLGSGVEQQMLKNKCLRSEFAKLAGKMVAFEDEMKLNSNRRQSLAACNWL